MARRIDNVESVIIPECCGCSGLDRDATLLFLFHEISCCRAIVNFTQLVDLSRQFQDPLCRSGLASIYVGENADISIFR